MRQGALVAAFSATAAIAVVVVSLVVFVFLPSAHSSPATSSPPPQFAAEPFPAVWQSNYTGVPAIATVANGTVFALTYGTSAATPLCELGNPWNLLAISLSNGSLEWSAQINSTGAQCVEPTLTIFDGVVYVTEAGDSLSVDSVIVATGPALYAVGFDPTTGAQVSLAQTPVPYAFFGGPFDLIGATAYLAWSNLTGTYDQVTVEAVSLLGTTHPVTQWKVEYSSNAGLTNLYAVLADPQYVVVPYGNLTVLSATSGAVVRTLDPSTLGVYYPSFNGALVGGTLYYVGEWGNPTIGQAVDYRLVGLNLSDGLATVNTSYAQRSFSSEPEGVRSLAGLLVVDVPQTVATSSNSGSFAVATLSGTVLWSGQSELAVFWYPMAPLADGSWLLSSLSSATETPGVATQYFEGVNATTGALLWSHSFSFASPPNAVTIYPPSGEGPNSVVALATMGGNLVYRWNSAIGVAVL